MLNLNDVFENVYVINLDQYQEKFHKTAQELMKNNITKFKRFSGIIVNNGKTTLDRELGCKFSHLKIVEEAKKNNYKNILIFEDDAQFLPNFEKYPMIINQFFNQIGNDNWDLFYLGGNHAKPYLPIDSNKYIVKSTRTLTTHAYAINHTVYDILLDFLYSEKEKTNPIDGILADIIQARWKSYCLFPRKVTQRVENSYIRQTVCDYNKYLYDACEENIK
jgi:GR25 family glycosyltransferase involved in LPS biosynthesis